MTINTLSLQELKHEIRKEIKLLDDISCSTQIILSQPPTAKVVIPVTTDYWNSDLIPFGSNVQWKLCDMCKASGDQTIANVFLREGAEIPPYRSNRCERIFVIEGSYFDPATGQEFNSGDTQSIEPLQLHGFTSNHALLVITFTPPYKRETKPKHEKLSN